jgi:DNA invertase Pin-like site-specific DNA recombinase
MVEIKVGYARVSTDEQDLTVQRDALAARASNLIVFMSIMASLAVTRTAQDCVKRWPRAEAATPSW